MKQRFSSLDVKVIGHELAQSLVTLRLANVYDLSSKILLLKFAKPDVKKQLIIDSGFRCHLTEFARTTASAPSNFVARLRKFLKTRRVTAVNQIGTDRILEFQFSDGQYRLFLEFFASGNVILTDSELKILTLLRNVPEGEGQEPQRVGLSYSLENRQNYSGVPPLTRDRLHQALETSVEREAAAAAAVATGKKAKRKPGDALRRGLATTMSEFPPILVEHAFKATKFDSTTKPADILQNQTLFDSLFASLEEARRIVDEIIALPSSKGYIIATRREGNVELTADQASAPQNLLYDDFHPFLPSQFEANPKYTILSFDGFNKTVDEFFSSLEGQKLESRLSEREAAAKRKLDAARQDQAKRLEGLQEAQLLSRRKASAIEANVERVQEAMDAINSLIDQGMDWVDIGKLVEREQKHRNPVAEIIKLPLRLSDNIITLRVAEEEADQDDDVAYETDSSSDDDYAATETNEPSRGSFADKRLDVDINLSLSPWGNAREYYEEKRTAAVKEEKTAQQASIALKNAEQKITQDLKKGLKQEKAILQPIRRQMWFEKFLWFISSDGYLVLGGRDAQSNDMLYKRYLRKGDVYVHADLHGAATVIIKNNPRTPDAPIPPSTLSQAGNLSVCSSSAWDSKAGMGAWWVAADQVSKSAPTGEYLPTGSFMVRGKKNFLPPAQLLLGFGLVFKISEESKARHIKHRVHSQDGDRDSAISGSTSKKEEKEVNEDDASESDDDEQGAGEESPARENPLQSHGSGEAETEAEGERRRESEEDEQEHGGEEVATKTLSDLAISNPAASEEAASSAPQADDQEQSESEDGESEPTAGATAPSSIQGGTSASQEKKKPAKRGQRGKAKKIATKYKDQDEEDRAAIETLIGATAGRQKAEASAKAKAEREAELEAARERRRAQHQRQQKETAEHEEVRRLMLDEGVEVLDDAELERSTPLDALVGTPLPGDEILEAIPVCAPWAAMARCKYKAKLQPGAQKKGKAVREVIDCWRIESGKKSAVDEGARDAERMWPREVELIKGMKPEEALNCVPVGKVKVMMSGGSGGGGTGGGSKGGAQGKGGKGSNKGSKKK